MKSLYRQSERLFERASNFSLLLFSNSIVFLLAIALVVYWLVTRDWKNTNQTDVIRDIILSITFLSFFVIQRVFTHFAQSLHLKINELVAADENARNHIINAEDKSDEELKEIAKEHDQLSKDAQQPL